MGEEVEEVEATAAGFRVAGARREAGAASAAAAGLVEGGVGLRQEVAGAIGADGVASRGERRGRGRRLAAVEANDSYGCYAKSELLELCGLVM